LTGSVVGGTYFAATAVIVLDALQINSAHVLFGLVTTTEKNIRGCCCFFGLGEEILPRLTFFIRLLCRQT
jgi:hypothetical protein